MHLIPFQLICVANVLPSSQSPTHGGPVELVELARLGVDVRH